MKYLRYLNLLPLLTVIMGQAAVMVRVAEDLAGDAADGSIDHPEKFGEVMDALQAVFDKAVQAEPSWSKYNFAMIRPFIEGGVNGLVSLYNAFGAFRKNKSIPA